MRKHFIISGCALLLLLSSCTPKKSPDSTPIATDSLSIVSGQVLFSGNCTACHNFTQDGIGPHLGGLTKNVDSGWIRDIIKGPKSNH